MKYAILSDIHSNIQAFEAVLKLCEQNKVERLACLGDIIGYNANPSECVDLAIEKLDFCIKGNHDSVAMGFGTNQRRGWSTDAIHGMDYSLAQLDNSQKKWLDSLPYFKTIRNKNIPFFIGHGIPFQREFYRPFDYVYSKGEAFSFIKALKENKKGIRLAFNGHTHVPSIIRGYDFDTENTCWDWDQGSYIIDESYGVGEIDLNPLCDGQEYLIINPGSVGQTRTSGKPSFVILDTIEKYLSFTPFDYDFKKAQKAVKEAGYSDRIADRLDYTKGI